MKERQGLAGGTNIHLLESESLCLADVVFLGATLWTDFALNGNRVVSEVVAQTGMNDYRRIRTLPPYSRLQPSDTRRIHMESRRWLGEHVIRPNISKVLTFPPPTPNRRSIPPALPRHTFHP